MTSARAYVVAATLSLSAAFSPASAGCLQDFTCTIHGECRFPCLPSSLAPTFGRPAGGAEGTTHVGGDAGQTRLHRSVAVARRAARIRVAHAVGRVGPDVAKATGHGGEGAVRVTIAADDAEADRIRTLQATIPVDAVRIRMVAGDRRDADMFVDASVKPAVGLEAGRDAKLFREDLHVVAARDVKSIGELYGRVVSFGPEGSASQAAGRRAFSALAIKVDETALDMDNALDGVASGDVAAVVVLAPPPFDRLKGLPGGVHLVPIPEPATPPNGMTTATIVRGTYPDLVGEDVRTFAVEATLRSTAKDDKPARALVAAMARNTDALSRKGFDLLKAEVDGTSRSASRDR